MCIGKILIVDDEKIVTSAFSTLLKVEGYEDVITFNNPLDAIDYLKNNSVDIIISDFLMPELNGLEFLSEAKKIYPEISMILLTGYADKENAIKAINEIGLYKYIEKPWDNDDLLVNIKNGIERSKLLDKLRVKISELEIAQAKLLEYSTNLEGLVAQRTLDLSEANNKLSSIINYCADGIVIIDNNGNIEQVNPACENLIGASSNTLLKKKFSEIVSSSSNDFVDCSNNANIFGLNSECSEILLRDLYVVNFLSEKRTPVEINFAIISSDENDLPNKFVGVIRDVSVQKETEQLRDDFIATLTHDMRTPLLAAIQTLRYFLDGAMGELNDKQEMILSTMLYSNEDLLGLVNALLEVYRFESGKLQLCKTNFSIKSLCNQCFEELKPLALKKNLEFNLNMTVDDDDLISADRAEIKRVITNLCGNAINYTNLDGKIDVFVKVQNDDLIFSVCDNGNGIPEVDVANLFKRFSQGTTRKRSTGTGLGLYLSRQIVEAHDGKIWVNSKVNKGSEFTFLLTDVLINEKGSEWTKSKCL
ncbi:MAG: ATP-binding protein [Candidatus Gastranaerophilales bacterium]